MYNYNQYIEVIKHNLKKQPRDWSFKSDFYYNSILEHVSSELGIQYLYYIQKEFTSIFENNKDDLIKLCKINDEYGTTNKYNFEGFCECSPSNLRYIYHALLNLKYMKKLDIINPDIIEIGGGYGGLCFFISRLCHLFDIYIKTYHIFDLAEAAELQRYYLNNLNVATCTTGVLYDCDNYIFQKDSYLISNYAFSEFNENIRNEYVNKVISPFTTHGMLVWNAIEPYKFIDKEIEVEVERPLTSLDNSIKNCFIYF